MRRDWEELTLASSRFWRRSFLRTGSRRRENVSLYAVREEKKGGEGWVESRTRVVAICRLGNLVQSRHFQTRRGSFLESCDSGCAESLNADYECFDERSWESWLSVRDGSAVLRGKDAEEKY